MDTITLTPQMLTDLLATAVAQGIREYEASKGGELSHNQCEQRYGSWFINAVNKGDLKGLRRGAKRNSKIVYQVKDIEALRAKEIAQTSNIINTK
jgi:hypothetical protein